MAKFRKKPVVIEAVQLRWDTWGEMCEHAGIGSLENGKPQGCYITPEGAAVDKYPGDYVDEDGKLRGARLGLWIPTLEGLMVGVENDWIIKGVQGELYPCKPDIFEATYESAEEVPV